MYLWFTMHVDAYMNVICGSSEDAWLTKVPTITIWTPWLGGLTVLYHPISKLIQTVFLTGSLVLPTPVVLPTPTGSSVIQNNAFHQNSLMYWRLTNPPTYIFSHSRGHRQIQFRDASFPYKIFCNLLPYLPWKWHPVLEKQAWPLQEPLVLYYCFAMWIPAI